MSLNRISLFVVIPLLVLLSSTIHAQQASDIYVVTLTSASQPTIESVTQISDNPQYSNQPHFAQNGNALFYTQMFKVDNDGEVMQSDSMRYDFNSGETTNLTKSNESEYSPTPYQQGFSTIHVDSQGKQWLWAYAADGTSKGKLSNSEPVGYHAWVNEGEALAFILGEPHTLQLISQESAKVLDSNIGASIWSVPNSKAFSYTRQTDSTNSDSDEPQHQVFTWQLSGETEVISTLPTSQAYYAWLPDASLITADNSVIMRATSTNYKTWSPWLDVSSICQGVSRMHAQSWRGKLQLALVCSR